LIGFGNYVKFFLSKEFLPVDLVFEACDFGEILVCGYIELVVVKL
jgi:hypothetical protein